MWSETELQTVAYSLTYQYRPGQRIGKDALYEDIERSVTKDRVKPLIMAITHLGLIQEIADTEQFIFQGPALWKPPLDILPIDHSLQRLEDAPDGWFVSAPVSDFN